MKQYWARVYARRTLPNGDVRLYLRNRNDRRCGSVVLSPKAAAKIPAGEYRQWPQVDHLWKRRKTRHGTRAGYQKGCRCNPCRAASRAYSRAHSCTAVPLPRTDP